MTRERDTDGDPSHKDEVSDTWFAPGSFLNMEVVKELPPPKFMVGPLPLEDIIANRGVVDAPAVLESLKATLGFEKGRGHHILHDTIGFVRQRAGRMEPYLARLERAKQKGKKEAANWGSIKINDREATLFSMNWDFLLGTLGSAVGQTFYDASENARNHNELFVAVFSSAGARQDEANPGLLQMPRMTRSIDSFKEKTDSPYVAVLSANVWGGISASPVPLADVIVGIRGTNYGFAGPNLIEGYSGKKVPEGAQSVEAHFVHRNVDVLVDGEEDLINWLKKFEKMTALARRKDTPALIPGTSTIPIRNAIYEKEDIDRRDLLYEQFIDLKKNASRPDGEYLMENVFD